MGLRLAERLRAPTFEDEERTRVAGLLHIIYTLIFVMLSGLFVLRIATTGLEGHWLFYPILLSLTLVLGLALRRGYVYSGGFTLALTLLAYAGVGAVSSGGLSSHALQVLAVVIMLGALLGSSRLVLGLTFASLALLGALAAVEFSGNMPPAVVAHTSTSIFFGNVANVVMMGLALTLIIEEIAAGEGATSTVVSVNNCPVCSIVMAFGSDAQKDRFLKPVARG